MNRCESTKAVEILKPALILGSGFHRYVFGDIDPKERRPIYDWHALIDQVSLRMRVAVPNQTLSPVQRWDTLVLRAIEDGFLSNRGRLISHEQIPPYRAESEARGALAAVLQDSALDYPESRRSQIPVNSLWGAVISLNFDSAWLQDSCFALSTEAELANILEREHLTHREHRRLTFSLLIQCKEQGPHRRVWFPNGSLFAKNTVRMGLHDYGGAPHAIQVAFNRLKQWERSIGFEGKRQGVSFSDVASALLKESQGIGQIPDRVKDFPLPLSWVADFLYRPLVFAGVGMSEQESGLWWLLAQRARNTVRLGVPNHAYILVNESERLPFWRNRPFGLSPIICSNWDEGWDKVLEKAESLCAS